MNSVKAVHLPYLCLYASRYLPLVCIGMALAGCSSRADVVVMLDSSQSSLPHRTEHVHLVNQVLNHLNPGQDHVSIYRLSQKVEVLYSGDPAPKSIGPSLEQYIKLEPSEFGTAYGSALTTGIDELKRLQATHEAAGEDGKSALLILGDAADEPVPGNSATSRMSDQLLNEAGRRLPDNSMLAFLFAEPHWSSRIYSILSQPLEGRLLLAPPPSATQPGTMMRLFTHLQR